MGNYIDLVLVYIFTDFVIFSIHPMYKVYDAMDEGWLYNLSHCPFCRGFWIGVMALAFGQAGVISGPILASVSVLAFNILVLKESLK